MTTTTASTTAAATASATALATTTTTVTILQSVPLHPVVPAEEPQLRCAARAGPLHSWRSCDDPKRDVFVNCDLKLSGRALNQSALSTLRSFK